MKREKRNRVVEIRKTIRGVAPNVPFDNIARSILGTRYDLSLVLCGDALARKINRAHRKKTYAANVLSFPLGKNEGEIFLNIEAARREARQFDVTLRARLTLLFAHGCLHLAGLTHGRTMDRLEARVVRKFS